MIGVDMKIKNCEGCTTLHKGNNRCSYYDDNLICPCSICLIKCMCREACDEFEKYRKQILIPIRDVK